MSNYQMCRLNAAERLTAYSFHFIISVCHPSLIFSSRSRRWVEVQRRIFSLCLLSGALKGNLMNNEEKKRHSEGGSEKNEPRRWGVRMRGPSRASIAFERIDIKKKIEKKE